MAPEFENTEFSVVTISRFSARSTCSLRLTIRPCGPNRRVATTVRHAGLQDPPANGGFKPVRARRRKRRGDGSNRQDGPLARAEIRSSPSQQVPVLRA
ncbi:hypothetical protein METY_0756 [Methylopila sp. Yamaguchi]|nr:hypothetical protein METY_0756 [Methylopila sp. Yamaguchi]